MLKYLELKGNQDSINGANIYYERRIEIKLQFYYSLLLTSDLAFAEYQVSCLSVNDTLCQIFRSFIIN